MRPAFEAAALFLGTVLILQLIRRSTRPRRVIGYVMHCGETELYRQYLAGRITWEQYITTPGETTIEPIYQDKP